MYIGDFLSNNRTRLALDQYGLGDEMTCVAVTPRFRASNHVLFMVLPDGKSDPILVAKVPRLQDASSGLEREATSLQFVQGLRQGGFESVPRVVAFEEFRGRPILLQTALVGCPLDPPLVRRNTQVCCKLACEWLLDLRLDKEIQTGRDNWYERQVEGTLNYLEEIASWDSQDKQRLRQTRKLLASLRTARIPTVLEHGDFSHPNVMLLKSGKLGAVDWETADLDGVPCHDLFFFLTYVAFAKSGARENGEHLSAIDSAFFGRNAWASPFVLNYADQLEISHDMLSPLFLLCWVRYMAGLLRRLNQSSDRIDVDTANWLRQNRYYSAWRHSLDSIDQLEWSGVQR